MQETGTDFKYELFFELSPDLLCIAGYDGYFKKINPAVSKLLGYTMEELYARPINDFVYHDDQQVTARVRTELTNAKPLFNFENRYVTKDGEIVWLSWTSLPVERDQLIFAIAKNITHKKSMDGVRNDLLTNMTQMNTDLKHLTYMTSHDLRSPVNNLLSIFDLLDITRIDDEETIELIEYLKLSGERLRQTLNNYVDVLSEKHSVHDNVETVDLDKELGEVMQNVDSLIKMAKASITADFSAAHEITFNKSYLHSILMNLITNSIKYARPDSLPVISMHTEKGGGFTRLIYEDNGMGFDMEEVKGRLFGLHQNFHENSEGKGIGLYLVFSHVTGLGGKIDIESKVDEGTTFTISFRDAVNNK